MVGIMQGSVIGLLALLCVMTLLPLSPLSHGVVRGAAFLRLQIIALALAIMVIAAVFMSPLVAAVAGAVVVGNLCYVAKYSPIWRRQSSDVPPELRADTARRLSVICANVKQSNREYPALVDLVQATPVDIVIALEVDAAWIDALEAGLGDAYPHRVKVPQDNTYGLCVMSRLELSDIQVRQIVTAEVPSVRTAVQLRDGALLRLYVVHPEPPVVHHDTHGRDSEIAHVGLEAEEDDLPAIVTGDLNDVAWSRTTRRFQRLSGLLDPRVGRGFYNTFHASYWWARWPLDHLFHDPRFRLVRMARLGDIGSDHFPMLFELALAAEPSQNAVPARSDDAEKAEVKEMIEAEKDRDRTAIGSDWED